MSGGTCTCNSIHPAWAELGAGAAWQVVSGDPGVLIGGISGEPLALFLLRLYFYFLVLLFLQVEVRDTTNNHSFTKDTLRPQIILRTLVLGRKYNFTVCLLMT